MIHTRLAGSAPSQSRFREALGHLPTGVIVITADTPAGPAGMSANSFTSVSLEPALVLFCPSRVSTTWPSLRAARSFCVNVLAGHHEGLCRQFARRGEDRFAGVDYHSRMSGPALDDAVAWIDCELDSEYVAGDHSIAVARVLDLEANSDAVPLLFHRGRYGSL